MAIPAGHEANFSTLLRAAGNSDLALVECSDAETGEPVYAICAIGVEDGMHSITPIARMFDGNPFELLNPPDINGDDIE